VCTGRSPKLDKLEEKVRLLLDGHMNLRQVRSEGYGFGIPLNNSGITKRCFGK
jgi:hypothetical protein